MLTGFILAAGFGTRLKPLTGRAPKALIPVCGKPLLQRALGFHHCREIAHIGVNSHYFPEQIESFRQQSSIPFRLFHETGKIRGTGGAFYFARDFLSEGKAFFCSNVDIIACISIGELYERFMASQCMAGMVAVPVAGKGSIYYDASTKEYRGAAADPNADGAAADFIGMAFYKREFLEVLSPEDISIVPVWKRAREMGHSVKIIEAGSPYWKDVGTPQALAQIHFDVLEKRLSLSTPSELIIENDTKRAYPRTFSSKEISRIGPEVWCEASSVPEGVFLERCVVMSKAEIPLRKHINNTIITPCGEIEIV
jgi:mannose-1-phosphate guanylyltransferase